MATKIHEAFRWLQILAFTIFFVFAGLNTDGEVFFLAFVLLGMPAALILMAIDEGIERLIKRAKNKRFTQFRQRVHDPASYSRE